MYKWQKVRTMRQKGESIKGIAKKLKLSKNTVRKYLRSDAPPSFHARQYERLLDPYKDEIEGMLESGYIGTRIYNELKDIGYRGSLSTVHRYITGIRKESKLKELATTRVETPPGKQLQYDWKEWNRRLSRILCLTIEFPVEDLSQFIGMGLKHWHWMTPSTLYQPFPLQKQICLKYLN